MTSYIVTDYQAYLRSGGKEGIVEIPDGATPQFGFGDSAENYNAGLMPGSGIFASYDPQEIADYNSHRRDVVTRGVGQVGALVGGAALGGALSGSSSLSPVTTTAQPISASAGLPGWASTGAAAASTAAAPIVGASTGAGLGVGGMANWLNWANLGSTVLGVIGADRAADAQVAGSDRAIAESQRQFDTARSDLMPTINLGRQSATQLGQINSGDMTPFTQSPGYQFNLAQGQQAIDRSLAARGKALSGQGVKEGIRYASGMASNEFGSFYDRLLASAGLGTTGAAASANAGANSAANIGNAAMAAGNARASGYANQYGALQGGVQNALFKKYLGV